MEYGQLFPHDNKEDEDLQHEGQGGSGSNQTKAKVCAMFLKLYATMPYMTTFIVARGISKLSNVLYKKLLLCITLLGLVGYLASTGILPLCISQIKTAFTSVPTTGDRGLDNRSIVVGMATRTGHPPSYALL